jgi:hypothetical protein
VLGALAGRRTNLRLLLLLIFHLRVLFLFLTCALHVELCTERSLEMEILLCGCACPAKTLFQLSHHNLRAGKTLRC